MRLRSAVLLGAAWMTGCGGGWNLVDDRPASQPAPADVRAEKRDARYFLALPERGAGPETGMYPRSAFH